MNSLSKYKASYPDQSSKLVENIEKNLKELAEAKQLHSKILERQVM